MKKFSVLAVCILLALMVAVPAWAGKDDLVDGFLGLAWGASADKLANKTKVEDADVPEGLDVVAYSVTGVQLGGIKVDEIQYFFYKDQFTQAVMNHSDFKALSEALIKEYGKPDAEQGNGMLNWIVMKDMDNNEMITVGTVPGQDVAAVVNTKYFIQLMEAMSQ